MYRIYIPEEYYWRSEGHGVFYGQARQTDDAGCNVVYIVSTSKDNESLDIVGVIDDDKMVASNMNSNGTLIHFTRHSKGQNNLILKEITPDTGMDLDRNVQIVLYKKRIFANLSESSNPLECEGFKSEFINLALLHNPVADPKELPKTQPSDHGILSQLIVSLSLTLTPLKLMFKGTAVAQHILEWIKIFNYRGGRKQLKRNILPILLDVLIGLIIMTVITKKVNPGASLMAVTHEIIVQLRILLENLRGSPVGLKINVQLNDFLLSCFMYHINLWRAFLDIVSPAINYLFAILSVFGLCGFSFQLAMLSDLLVLITIHAHCFYIYAAVLYRLEIIGLKALWRVVVGRRKNVLKNRVESYDYKHSQLFLATLLFSSLLFLLPTILVYYVVFSTLRLAMYCTIFTLLIVRRKLLQLPIYETLRCLLGIHHTPDNIIVELVSPPETTLRGDHKSLPHSSRVTVMKLKPGRSPLPGKIPNEEFETNYPSIGEFLTDLLKGEIKGFIRPNGNTDDVRVK